MKLGSKATVLNYHYPKWLMRNPVLIRLVFILNYYVQLRKWTIISVWKKTLRKQPSHFIAVDMGSGESQYLIPFCNQYPKAQFWAIDNHLQSVLFAQNYPINNLYSKAIDIAAEHLNTKADIVLCVGVLQYIIDDKQALRNINTSLKKDGELLLYVPINGQAITCFYEWVCRRYPNYESIHNRQRIYSEIELMCKLKEACLEPTSKTYTYGKLGIISHEISSGLNLLLIHGNIFIKAISLLLIVLFTPINCVLMMLDFNLPKNDGNGILVCAKKIKEI